MKPERLRGGHIHQLLGERLFHRDIWRINRRSIAGGLSLGLFIAFTPTIPFQMLLSALGAIWFRVNFPIAIAACWVTNPFTAVWIYLMEYRLGKAVMEKLPDIFFVVSEFENIGAFRRIFSHATYVWIGGTIFGLLAALLAYAGIQILWRLLQEGKNRRK